MQRSAGLDLMRALAITLVLLHHFLELVNKHSPWVLLFYGWGLTGVDIFFALSGFLIGRILLKMESVAVKPVELLRFWARRWLRTLPLYYVMLLLRVLMAFAILLYLKLDWNLGHKVFPYFFFMQSWAWPPPSFFVETWSLTVEEWFYLLFPLLWAAVICGGVRPFRAFILVSVFMLLASTIQRLDTPSRTSWDWIVSIGHSTIYHFDSIAFGLLGAALCVACPRIWTRWRWPGLVFGAGFLWLDHHLMGLDLLHNNGYLGVWHCSITGLGSTLLLPWCSGVEKLFWRPLQSLVALMARWSYSLYLTHSVFFIFAQHFFASQIERSSIWAWGFLVVTVPLSFVLAGAAHRWIEKPGMSLRERWEFTREARPTLPHRQISN